MLWILAGLSIALLAYEAWTLIGAVLLPLLANPHAIQTDFHYYYDAALRFRGDPARLYQLSDDVIAGFAYPPPAILPFVALSALPLGVALLVLTIASYAAILTAVTWWMQYLNRRGMPVDARAAAAVVVIAVALGPTYSNAVFGQVNAFVLLCAVGFVTIGSSRPAAGGALLASGIWLKIYPIVMVAIGLWTRDAWRRTAYAAGAAVMLFLLALPILPLSSYDMFVTEVLPLRFDKTAVHISNQSLVAFVERFAVPPDRFLDWTGEQAIAVGGAVRATNWVFGITVIALLWRRAVRRPGVAVAESTAALIALAAVIAPLGWGHTFVLVLPLVALHLLSMRRAGVLQTILVAGAVVAMMIPAGRRFGILDTLAPWMQNLFYSRYLLATLLLMALPAAPFPDVDTRRQTQ